MEGPPLDLGIQERRAPPPREPPPVAQLLTRFKNEALTPEKVPPPSPHFSSSNKRDTKQTRLDQYIHDTRTQTRGANWQKKKPRKGNAKEWFPGPRLGRGRTPAPKCKYLATIYVCWKTEEVRRRRLVLRTSQRLSAICFIVFLKTSEERGLTNLGGPSLQLCSPFFRL